MKILSQKPKNLSLIEYFKTLNVFDKRELINELEIFKSISSDKVNFYLFLSISSIVVSLICIAILPHLIVISFYSILSTVIVCIFLKKKMSYSKFESVIDYLQKNM